jgi:hypothetical protein
MFTSIDWLISLNISITALTAMRQRDGMKIVMNLKRSCIPIFIVYARSTINLGSTYLRAFQLADCIRQYGSGQFDVNLLPVTNMRLSVLRKAWCLQIPRGAVVWFCKDAITRLDPDAREFLWRRSAAVLIDHIDRDVKNIENDHVDCHVAISITQKRYFDELFSKEAKGQSALLHHQANSFFYQKFERDTNVMNLGYFGALNNCLVPQDLIQKIQIIDAEASKDWSESAAMFARCNAHYAVRPHTPSQHRRVFKPLLKVFTAAVCNVPVVIHRQHDDFDDLLGPEYPYAVDQDEPHSIIDTVDCLQAGWSGVEYRLSLDILASVSKLVSLEAIAQNFELAVEVAIENGKKTRR